MRTKLLAVLLVLLPNTACSSAASSIANSRFDYGRQTWHVAGMQIAPTVAQVHGRGVTPGDQAPGLKISWRHK